MARILNIFKSVGMFAVISGCINPETHAAPPPSSTSLSGKVDMACISAVQADPVYELLRQRLGTAESCSRLRDFERGIDFGEVFTVTWEGADLRVEQRPPESAIVVTNFAPSIRIDRDWFRIHRDMLVPAALGIDWNKDLAVHPRVEQYESVESGVNGTVKIVTDDAGNLASFRLSYAL